MNLIAIDQKVIGTLWFYVEGQPDPIPRAARYYAQAQSAGSGISLVALDAGKTHTLDADNFKLNGKTYTTAGELVDALNLVVGNFGQTGGGSGGGSEPDPNKVDRTSVPNVVYGTDETGDSALYPVGISPVGASVPLRDANGGISVPTNVSGNKAIGAAQVASLLAALVPSAPRMTKAAFDAAVTSGALGEGALAIVSGVDTQYRAGATVLAMVGSGGAYTTIWDQYEGAAHAAHDARMFDDLVGRIEAAEFSEDQITAIVNAAIEAAGQDVATKTWVTSVLEGYVKTDSLPVLFAAFLNGDVTALIQKMVGEAYASSINDMYAIAREVYEGVTPPMDTDNPTIVAGSGGIIGVGGTTSWQATGNGTVVCTYSGVVGVANVSIAGEDYALVSALFLPARQTVRVNNGDTIEVADILTLLGTLTITFYPNK